MQSPIVSICGGVTAIGDYNGRNIYIYNEEKQLGIITTKPSGTKSFALQQTAWWQRGVGRYGCDVDICI